MAKRRRSSGCSVKQISFKTKRGRRVSFKGRHGAACSPRRFGHSTPSSFKPWAAAAKACARKRGAKVGSKAMTSCMKAQVRG